MAGHRVIVLAETGSTNKDTMRLALAGEALPLWVSADRQTAGRGRAGRTWVSIAGNLHASVGFTTPVAPEKAGELALVAGIMVFEAVAAAIGVAQKSRLRLKWPNDLLVGGAKAGGILVESTLDPRGEGLLAVIGFGLNIVSAPEGLDRPVTSFAQECLAVGRDQILAALAREYDRWMGRWDNGRGFSIIRTAWMDRGGPLGEPVAVNTGSGPISGSYKGLSETGALLVEVEGRLETFTFGDVALGNGAA